MPPHSDWSWLLFFHPAFPLHSTGTKERWRPFSLRQLNSLTGPFSCSTLSVFGTAAVLKCPVHFHGDARFVRMAWQRQIVSRPRRRRSEQSKQRSTCTERKGLLPRNRPHPGLKHPSYVRHHANVLMFCMDMKCALNRRHMFNLSGWSICHMGGHVTMKSSALSCFM